MNADDCKNGYRKKLTFNIAGLALIAALSQRATAGVATKKFVFEKGEVVNLCFLNSQQNLVTQKLVKEVAATWLQHANITFNFIKTPCRQISWWDVPRKNLVRIYTDKNFPNQSLIGKQVNEVPFPQPTLWLKISDTSIKLTTQERSAALHEFGHALGLEHEHFHPDIQAKMSSSVVNSCIELSLDPSSCDENLISRTDPSNLFLEPFDKDSIMLYNLASYSPDFAQYTRKTTLSAGDIAFIKKLYPK